MAAIEFNPVRGVGWRRSRRAQPVAREPNQCFPSARQRCGKVFICHQCDDEVLQQSFRELKLAESEEDNLLEYRAGQMQQVTTTGKYSSRLQ